jgi:hypothetical protein
MIRRIREHNHLNGITFVIGEFVLVTAAALFISVGFAREGNVLGTILAAGTTLNSLVVLGFAIASFTQGERGAGISKLFSSTYRANVEREHPSLMADTLVLTAAVLVPYFLAASVVYEAATSSKSPKA